MDDLITESLTSFCGILELRTLRKNLPGDPDNDLPGPMLCNVSWQMLCRPCRLSGQPVPVLPLPFDANIDMTMMVTDSH